MMDPDAPSRQNPKAAQWLHWLVVNISGDEFIILLRIVAHWPAVNINCMYDVRRTVHEYIDEHYYLFSIKDYYRSTVA